MSLLPLCIAILYFKVEVGLCNQTNVSNNKRRMVPLGPFFPRKLIKHVCKFVLSMMVLFIPILQRPMKPNIVLVLASTSWLYDLVELLIHPFY